MRKFAPLTFACVVFLLAGFAQAQLDIFAGGGELAAPGPDTSAQSYLPPAEKGGIYANLGAELILKEKVFHQRAAIMAEGAWRYKSGFYNGYQANRPMFFDANAVWAPILRRKMALDLFAGVGVERVLFYDQFERCSASYPVCIVNTNADHFLAHLGGAYRYYFFHNLFVRPEAHLYLIPDNSQFHSDFVGRGSVSIGYTFGR